MVSQGWPRRAAERPLPAGERLRSLLYRQSLTVGAALMDGASLLVRRLPTRYRYLPADAITVPLGLLPTRRRALIERNYSTLLGLPAAHAHARRLARRSIRNFGRMAIDFLIVRTMADPDVYSWVIPEGQSYFDQALEARRGVIFVLPHAGSWDIAAAFAQAYGCKLNVVTEPSWAAELVAGSRRGHGVTLVPRDRSLRPLFRALARNECAVMLSDIARDDVQSLAVPFGPHPAPFPMGPARLGQHTGAPILVVSCLRLRDGRYLIKARPPLFPDPALPAMEDVKRLTGKMAEGFEHIVRAAPDQWYPFHPVWPESQQ